jgi:hypothetical protein
MKQAPVAYEMSPSLAQERAQTCRRALMLLARLQDQARDPEAVAGLLRVQRDLRALADFLEGPL